MAASNCDQSIRSASTYSGCSGFNSSLSRAPNNSHCGVAAFGFIFCQLLGPKEQNLANFSAMITAMHPLFVAAKEFFRDDYISIRNCAVDEFWHVARRHT